MLRLRVNLARFLIGAESVRSSFLSLSSFPPFTLFVKEPPKLTTKFLAVNGLVQILFTIASCSVFGLRISTFGFHSRNPLLANAPFAAKLPATFYERPHPIPLAAHRAPRLLQLFHDLRLVRPPKIQSQAAPARHLGELGHRLF